MLGHRISSKGIEVDQAKVEVIEKLPPSTIVKAMKSFLGHARFYRHFITWLKMCHLIFLMIDCRPLTS